MVFLHSAAVGTIKQFEKDYALIYAKLTEFKQIHNYRMPAPPNFQLPLTMPHASGPGLWPLVGGARPRPLAPLPHTPVAKGCLLGVAQAPDVCY